MKQDMSADTAGTEKSVNAAQTQKHQKNLYEPYSTPRIIWELILRPLGWTIFFLRQASS